MSEAGDPLERPSPKVMIGGWVVFVVVIWWQPTHGLGPFSKAWIDTVFISVALPALWYIFPRFRR